MVRKGLIIGSVVGLVVGAGVGVLIWWLVTREQDPPPRFETIPVEGDGFRDVSNTAAFTRIPGAGDMFWWFYPSVAAQPSSRPLLLWLDGVTGLPPSLLANFAMFGPYDLNMNRREESWINEYNLLFIDAPLGAGFSKLNDNVEVSMDATKNAEHLLLALESFYSHTTGFEDTPLYIFGQGYGAQLALSLALKLQNEEHISPEVKGVVLGNPIVSPALALTKLGFYLEELGYIDGKGRVSVEAYTNTLNNLVNQGQFANAFKNFISVGEFVNQQAGTAAVNLHHIIEKLTDTSTTSKDIFGQRKYLRDIVGYDMDLEKFMNDIVSPALGVSNADFNGQQTRVLQAFEQSFMVPATEKVEKLLSDTNITVTIYNGNLDAVSNTPGQLEWVHNLNWPGQSEFLQQPRKTLALNGLLEGYIRENERLKFYWMNAAGLMVPIDSSAAMLTVLRRITN